MALELPLKIRVDVRDLWDSPKSDLQASISSLEETLGHRIEPVVQWLGLWNELKDRYSDKATFVPSIARIVNAWYSRLSWRLESDNFPEWTEELLELLSSSRKQLLIEPSPPPHVRPKTSWNIKTSSFYLGLPKLEPPSHSKVVAAFDQDFDNLLNQNGASGPDEGWDEVTAEPSASGGIGVGGGSQRATATANPVREAFDERPKVDRLPKLSELSRPNELFVRTAPHILTLDMGNPLVVRCSHEGTLELLCTYFNQWGKANANDSRGVRKDSTLCTWHVLIAFSKYRGTFSK
ncbi:hypothetical protein H0H92_008608 [Tricholoma furcatifolium]|nr:hypothetical protein H0H92_008608 [Tricholoma furcatifolium]